MLVYDSLLMNDTAFKHPGQAVFGPLRQGTDIPLERSIQSFHDQIIPLSAFSLVFIWKHTIEPMI
jgi:hypothetical protein